MNKQQIHEKALKEIAKTSLVDFPGAFEWAKFCRALAQSALDQDEEMLEIILDDKRNTD